jgi:PIN domain nuclease of toxin-antitoxin system
MGARASRPLREARLTPDDIYRASELPALHADPYDRLLVATAIGRRLSLLTPDEWLKRYPVSCLW